MRNTNWENFWENFIPFTGWWNKVWFEGEARYLIKMNSKTVWIGQDIIIISRPIYYEWSSNGWAPIRACYQDNSPISEFQCMRFEFSQLSDEEYPGEAYHSNNDWKMNLEMELRLRKFFHWMNENFQDRLQALFYSKRVTSKGMLTSNESFKENDIDIICP